MSSARTQAVLSRVDSAIAFLGTMEPNIQRTMLRNQSLLVTLRSELHDEIEDDQIEARVSRCIEGCRQHLSHLQESLNLREIRNELREIRLALSTL